MRVWERNKISIIYIGLIPKIIKTLFFLQIYIFYIKVIIITLILQYFYLLKDNKK